MPLATEDDIDVGDKDVHRAMPNNQHEKQDPESPIANLPSLALIPSSSPSAQFPALTL